MTWEELLPLTVTLPGVGAIPVSQEELAMLPGVTVIVQLSPAASAAEQVEAEIDVPVGNPALRAERFSAVPNFSEANLAAPANLLDVQPSVTLSLTDHLSCSFSWNALGKCAEADAFYAPPLSGVEDYVDDTHEGYRTPAHHGRRAQRAGRVRDWITGATRASTGPSPRSFRIHRM